MAEADVNKIRKCEHPDCDEKLEEYPGRGSPRKYCDEHRKPIYPWVRNLYRVRDEMGMSEECFKEFENLYWGLLRVKQCRSKDLFMRFMKTVYEQDLETYIMLYEGHIVSQKQHEEIISNHANKPTDILEANIGDTLKEIKKIVFGAEVE